MNLDPMLSLQVKRVFIGKFFDDDQEASMSLLLTHEAKRELTGKD